MKPQKQPKGCKVDCALQPLFSPVIPVNLREIAQPPTLCYNQLTGLVVSASPKGVWGRKCI